MFYMEGDEDVREMIGKLDLLWKSEKLDEGEVNAVLPKVMNKIDDLYKELVMYKIALVDAEQKLARSDLECPYDNGSGSCKNPMCWDQFLKTRARHSYAAAEIDYNKKHVQGGKGITITGK